MFRLGPGCISIFIEVRSPTFFAIKEVWSPVRIAESSLARLPRTFGGVLRVENLYDFTSLSQVGFRIDAVAHRVIEARVSDWYEFLSAYHDGVLGWAGGTEKIDGQAPDDATVALRLQLIEESLERLFEHQPTFRACWTYLTCTRPG